MPAAAVIPAPLAYIKVVAVKKLVVGFQQIKYALGHYDICFFNDLPLVDFNWFSLKLLL